MLSLSFTFPAGRYHATPWDRHVNEGAVAWPPEPWRILRALIATWHHKVKHSGKYSESTLLGLVEKLAEKTPEYTLPAASHSHTRHYMPQYHVEKKNNTSLIFDAFTAVKQNDPLTVTWPTIELTDGQAALLDELLSVMGYLGRAESWVEARRLNEVPEASEAKKCVPEEDALDTETGELKGEIVTLFAPLPGHEYQALRQRVLTDKKAAAKLGKTLPENLLEALAVDTADLRKQGWNQPPAARKVNYLRPVNALRPVRVIHKAELPWATTAQFILVGKSKPLPRVEDSLRIGELMRLAVMGQAKRLFGEGNIPAIFSGHGLPEDNRHGHAFYLPWDSDGDGCLDRLLVHVPLGMDVRQRRVLEKLNRIRSRNGDDWYLVLESIGDAEIESGLIKKSVIWQSVTPYLHPWFRKKNFTVEDQIRRECRERGLPEPQIEPLPHITIKGRQCRPIHFHRFRSKHGLTQPDTHGSFWKLTFPELRTGPLALGFGCHYGLGLFKSGEPHSG